MHGDLRTFRSPLGDSAVESVSATSDSPLRFVHPVNLGLLHGFRKVSARTSFRESMRWILRACDVRVHIESGEFVLTGPQLVVANHPSPMDPPILGAIVDRDDSYFVGSAGLQSFSPQLAEHVFPIYMSQKYSPYLFTKLKNNVFHRLREGVDREEARRRNHDSLRRAAARLNDGGSLILCPTGGTFVTTTDWKIGVGVLIHNAKPAEGSMVFVRIEGTSRWDLLRLMNPYWFGPFLKEREARVRIHRPQPLVDFWRADESPQQISDRIKQGYLDAFGSL
jgi:1-acyl-sn-glycerol-3-phosphate acyltransferase